MSYCKEFHQAISRGEHESCAYPLIDAHIHCVDFLQESDGLESLISRMDESGVKSSVVFGLPVCKKWSEWAPERPYYYLDDNARCYCYVSTDEDLARDYLALDETGRKRFAPMLCGFNPTDRNSVFQVEKKLDAYDFWRGVGEIMCRHDDLTNLTMEETARMDHPALMAIYDLAGQRGLPVMLHQNSSSVGRHDEFEYLSEVKDALSAFPETIFHWAHCGISRRVGHKLYHRMVEGMLEEHENLFVDLSWVVYDQTVCTRHVPKESWVKLIEGHPDRFMVGSDLCGHFDLLGKTMGRYNGLMEILSPSTRDMLCTENATRIYWRV